MLTSFISLVHFIKLSYCEMLYSTSLFLSFQVPEMNQVVEAKENKELGITQLFILQNIGMIIGFGIILIISLYAEDIKFGS